MTDTDSVRILGIDPGSRVTGYGVVDTQGQRLRFVACGCLHISADDLGKRLQTIHEGVLAIVREHVPHEIAAERVFVHRNPASALKLGQARGAALVAGVGAGLPLFEYSPNQIKQAITGRGHAQKAQIQHMVKVLLRLSELPSADAADALAVAICHGHVRATRARIECAAGELE